MRPSKSKLNSVQPLQTNERQCTIVFAGYSLQVTTMPIFVNSNRHTDESVDEKYQLAKSDTRKKGIRGQVTQEKKGIRGQQVAADQESVLVHNTMEN